MFNLRVYFFETAIDNIISYNMHIKLLIILYQFFFLVIYILVYIILHKFVLASLYFVIYSFIIFKLKDSLILLLIKTVIIYIVL